MLFGVLFPLHSWMAPPRSLDPFASPSSTTQAPGTAAPDVQRMTRAFVEAVVVGFRSGLARGR